MAIKKILKEVYERTQPPTDYLKYWRVIRRWVKAKHNLGNQDLEMLLFLYSEIYFNKDKFNEYNQLMSWNKKRFTNLLTNGWIRVFRTKRKNETTLYELSYKGRRTIGEVYKKLSGEEFAETEKHNPMFRPRAPYTDVVFRNYIRKINMSIRKQRRDIQNQTSPEDDL